MDSWRPGGGTGDPNDGAKPSAAALQCCRSLWEKAVVAAAGKRCWGKSLPPPQQSGTAVTGTGQGLLVTQGTTKGWSTWVQRLACRNAQGGLWRS